MKLSVVIPAWNEAALLPACLEALDRALAPHGQLDRELIVVDNNSTDATADVARAAHATVVFEPVNQIARARNAGAACATGEWLMFLDADSIVSQELVDAIVTLIRRDQMAGCGCVMRMAGLPLWARLLLHGWNLLSVGCRWASGALLVCRAADFRQLGGFSERLYAAEEIDLSRRLKRLGRRRGRRFEILRAHPLHTSNRKLTLYSAREILGQLGRLVFSPVRTLRSRERLGVWYDGRR